MGAELLQPAFDEPVLAAQRSFRAALKAIAEPGLVQPLEQAPALCKLAPATYALCLSLLDSDTALWLSPELDTPAIRANLRFHCGCRIVAEREAAQFALFDVAELTDLTGFCNGSERYPDQSCTLLVQLPAFDGGAQRAWSGPGIESERLCSLPLPDAFWRQREARSDFPRGLDVFFAADDQVVGLARSTRVRAITKQEAS